MQLSKNKTAAIFIMTLLIVSMGASTVLMTTASAHTPSWQLVTNAYITAAPNPIGVGQTTLIYMWLNRVFDSALMGNDYRFHNYKLDITAPNGQVTEKVFPNVSDSTSNQGYSFTPDQVGTYTLSFTFPGNNINDFSHSPTSLYVNDTYLPSNATTTLTVQQQPLSNLPYAPLPTEYWSRPIYGENPNWWSIASNWLGRAHQTMAALQQAATITLEATAS